MGRPDKAAFYRVVAVLSCMAAGGFAVVAALGLRPALAVGVAVLNLSLAALMFVMSRRCAR